MLGALIGAGASLLGGFMQSKQADKQAALQKKFAQNGVQWKVEDAKKAGVHPIYALGAQTHSYAPQAVGDLGISAAGQDIARAVDTGASSSERFNNVLGKLQIERATLENQKLASEIALLRQPGHPPAPYTENPVVPGQAVTTSPAPATVANPAIPATDLAVTPEVSYARTAEGYSPVPSETFKKATEDNILLEAGWAIRNQIAPTMGVRSQTVPPPKAWLPFGANTWKYDALTQQWRPYNSNLNEYVRNSNMQLRR